MENLLIYGADVSNAFAEAPPPKQGFNIWPDKTFLEWWTSKKDGRKTIPPGYVIPVLLAMQGHHESPCLWECLIDKILCDMGFILAVHEPCLYSGLINKQRVIFMSQVNDFAVAAPNERIANQVFNMLNDQLTFSMKHMGLINRFNGLDIS